MSVAAAERLDVPDPRHRLLAELDPNRLQRPQRSLRLRSRPSAVGVDTDDHVGPGEGADRGESAVVIADRDLDLDRVKAGRAGLRRLPHRARAVGGFQRPVDTHRLGVRSLPR